MEGEVPEGDGFAQIFVTGNNREGQAGIGGTDDCLLSIKSLSTLYDCRDICRASVSQKQSYFCKRDGSVVSCGDNENNELGRRGKKSLLQRIDSLEAFQILDVAAGDNFVIMVLKDGRMVSWGQNSLGQLGNGVREDGEKPRVFSTIPDGVLQISAGSQHVVCISRNGDVFTWGGNRKGQLGDGQLTSSCNPILLPQLKHRPVIMVSCGESHTLALTAGGNVYSWGDNSR